MHHISEAELVFHLRKMKLKRLDKKKTHNIIVELNRDDDNHVIMKFRGLTTVDIVTTAEESLNTRIKSFLGEDFRMMSIHGMSSQ